MKKHQIITPDIIANLLRDKLELKQQLDNKNIIIEELKKQLSYYERRLSCQK